MAQCFVLGESGRSSKMAQSLLAKGVSCRVFAMPHSHPKFLEVCTGEEDLEAFVVFARDFEDNGAPLMQMLRDALGKDVLIYAIFDARQAPVNGKLKGIANEVFWQFPLSIPSVVEVVMKRIVSKSGTAPEATETVLPPGGRQSRRVAIEADPSDEPEDFNLDLLGDTTPPDAPKRDAKVGKPPPAPNQKAALASKPVPTAPVKVAEKERPKPPEEVKAESEEPSILAESLRKIKKNSPLPKVPVKWDISGVPNYTRAELDPRRIKPLPDNPRWKNNPGFAVESLRQLGESMRTFGQLDAGLVCPIVGDPDFDAQLLDGERRLRGSLLEGIMLVVDVRTDITPDMEKELYLLSVVRNTEKARHTVLEYVAMVKKFRGPDYHATQSETALMLGVSKASVVRYEKLGKLDVRVQQLLDDGASESEEGKSAKYITSQIALLLIDVEPEKQLSTAEEIISREMNYTQARRYVLNVRRGLGLKASAQGRRRPSKEFDALATLTRRNLDAYGELLDKPTIELLALSSHRTSGERSGLEKDLRELVKRLEELVSRMNNEE